MTIEEIRKEYSDRAFFSQHALERMQERNISEEEVDFVVANGIPVETMIFSSTSIKYVICGQTETERYIHVVLHFRGSVVVVTVYDPSLDMKWDPNTGYTTRLRQEG